MKVNFIFITKETFEKWCTKWLHKRHKEEKLEH